MKKQNSKTPEAGRSPADTRVSKTAKGGVVVALGFVSAIGIAGLADADVMRVQGDIETLRATAGSGAEVSHPVLQSILPTDEEALKQICHSNSYSQSVSHNQGHGQTYDC